MGRNGICVSFTISWMFQSSTHCSFIIVIWVSMAEPTKRAFRLQERNRHLPYLYKWCNSQGPVEDPSNTKTVALQKDQRLPNLSHMIVFTMTASSIGRRQWLIRSNAGSAPLMLESSVQSARFHCVWCRRETVSKSFIPNDYFIFLLLWSVSKNKFPC